MESQ
jgi:hypothetical protein